MLEMGFFAVGAVDRDDAFSAEFVQQGDGVVQSDDGFFFFALFDQDLDLFDGGAELGFGGFISQIRGFIGLVTFDLGFDVWHGVHFLLFRGDNLIL